jgi:hypothetical protein
LGPNHGDSGRTVDRIWSKKNKYLGQGLVHQNSMNFCLIKVICEKTLFKQYTTLKVRWTTRPQNTSQNLNMSISVYLIYESRMWVLILVFEKQTFFLISFNDYNDNDKRKKHRITWIPIWNQTSITILCLWWKIIKNTVILIYIYIHTRINTHSYWYCKLYFKFQQTNKWTVKKNKAIFVSSKLELIFVHIWLVAENALSDLRWQVLQYWYSHRQVTGWPFLYPLVRKILFPF